tara:strand:+ start:184 stop:486 length:303 start_codon:yes stop_codon:yes gene_type:complete
MADMSTRRHYTRHERERLLALFDHTDSTALAFCREHQLCYQTFLRWRKLARDQVSEPAPEFIEIEVPSSAPRASAAPQVELTFPGGLTLRIFAPIATPQP